MTAIPNSGGGGVKAGGAYVEITGRTSKLMMALKSANAKVRAFADSATALGTKLMAGGGVMAAPFISAAVAGARFDDEMAKVKAVTKSTGDDFASLRDEAKRLGRTTSFTASEAAQGMKFLGMANFNTKQILAGIPEVLNLARAGALDLGEAADIASDVGTAFKLAAEDIGMISDVIATTASNANTSVGQMGEAMKYLAPSARAAGQSLEDASLAIGLVGNAGIKGTMAGTSLANTLRKLVDAKTKKKMKELGIEVLDTAGNIRPLTEVMQELGKATKDMGGGERLALFQELFDARAAKAAINLADASQDSVARLRKEIRNASGEAARMAKDMDDNLGGSWRILMSAVEGLQIALNDVVKNTLRSFLDRAKSVVETMTTWIATNQKVVQGALQFTKTLLGAGAALLLIGKGAKLFAFLVSPIGLVITALVLLTEAFGGVNLGLKDMVSNFRVSGVKIGTWFEVLGLRIMKVWEEVSTQMMHWVDVALHAIGVNVQDIQKFFVGAASTIAQAFWKAVGGVMDAFRWLAKKTVDASYELHLIDDRELVKAHQALDSLGKGIKANADLSKEYYAGILEDIGEGPRSFTEIQKQHEERSKNSADRIKAINAGVFKSFKEDANEAAKSSSSNLLEKLKGLKDKLGKEPGFELPNVAGAGSESSIEVTAPTEAWSDRRGTFSARAAMSGFGGSGIDKVAKNTEEQLGILDKIAKNTKKAADKRGGLILGA